MEKFSIVIPTMWRSPLIRDMVPVYAQSAFVEEIIIINNTSVDIEPYHDKMVVSNMGKNTYVNPAWNHGNSIKKKDTTLVLANDDILITGFDKMIGMIQRTSYCLVGATVNTPSSTPGITKVRRGMPFPRNHFGCFMVVRKYHNIPKELLIIYGDNYLFHKATSVGIIKGGFISTPGSATLRNPELNFRSLLKEDSVSFRKLKRRIR